jgi:hypothetical protein
VPNCFCRPVDSRAGRATACTSPAFGSGLVTLGEVVGCDFAGYPNIKHWLDNMKRLPSWPKVNQVFYGLVDAVKGQSFVRSERRRRR